MSDRNDTFDKCCYPALNSQSFPNFIERICGNCEERIDASRDIYYTCCYYLTYLKACLNPNPKIYY